MFLEYFLNKKKMISQLTFSRDLFYIHVYSASACFASAMAFFLALDFR